MAMAVALRFKVGTVQPQMTVLLQLMSEFVVVGLFSVRSRRDLFGSDHGLSLWLC